MGHSAAHAALGREFPAGLRRGRRRRTKIPGRVAGGIYAANTLGGIVGALAVSLVLIPLDRNAADPSALLAVVSALSALFVARAAG